MGLLVLVRHGITQYNQEKRHCGWIDIPVSEEGLAQVATTAQKILARGITFSGAYISWLQRSQQTAELILQKLDQANVPVIRHPFLNERHYGDLQGMLHADVVARWGEEQFKLWRRSYAVRPPNGESLADVVVRTQHYLNTEIIPRVQAGENILVSGHSNSNRSIIKQLEHISDQDIIHREVAYDEPLIYEL